MPERYQQVGRTDPSDRSTPPAFLSLADAVDHTGVTARTIRRWVADDRVRSRYVDGYLYVDLADLNRTEAATRRRGGKRRLWDNRPSLS